MRVCKFCLHRFVCRHREDGNAPGECSHFIDQERTIVLPDKKVSASAEQALKEREQ